ncbi:MAG TPA: DNRLRE domain-containing protein [Anaerolineaceae bacterium]
MPNAFDITTPSTTVTLDATRSGQASISVSNVSGQKIRGRVSLKAVDPNVIKWLTLQGEPETDYDVNTARQYTVQIRVPMSQAAGTYAFHLEAIGVDNPDEIAVEGPVMSFKLDPLPAPPPKKLPWWWWIPVAVVGVILLIVLLVVLFTPHTINIPINQDTSWAEPPQPTDFGHIQVIAIARGLGGSYALNQDNVNYDLTKLASTSAIQKATLHLFLAVHVPAATPSNLTASLGTTDWNESQNAPVPSCNFSVSSAITVPATTANGWVEIDVTSILQKQRGGGVTNFGTCLTSNDAAIGLLFVSHEGPAASQPFLTVTYVH